MNEDREALIEAAACAYREVGADGVLRSSPAWHDLDESGRRAVHARAVVNRRLEAGADPEGLSTAARAVLRRIRAG